MPTNRKLDLRVATDRMELYGLLNTRGLDLEPGAIDFAATKLNEDWLTAWASLVFNIRTSAKGTFGLQLPGWVETIRSIFEMRNLKGIDEQIRRLCIPSHEALDTDLVVRIAGKYHRSGFDVSFEPNGRGCSDLLIEGPEFRSYAEIKRENEQDHKRQVSVWRVSSTILEGAEREIRNWLEVRDLRMEIKCSRSFSVSLVPKIIREIRNNLENARAGSEQALETVPGSRYVVLPRQRDLFFGKGIRMGRITVKQAGTPVPMTPENTPVMVIFDRIPNLKALKQRLQKASMQLKRDALKDCDAQGFVVL